MALTQQQEMRLRGIVAAKCEEALKGTTPLSTQVINAFNSNLTTLKGAADIASDGRPLTEQEIKALRKQAKEKTIKELQDFSIASANADPGTPPPANLGMSGLGNQALSMVGQSFFGSIPLIGPLFDKILPMLIKAVTVGYQYFTQKPDKDGKTKGLGDLWEEDTQKDGLTRLAKSFQIDPKSLVDSVMNEPSAAAPAKPPVQPNPLPPNHVPDGTNLPSPPRPISPPPSPPGQTPP